VAERLGVDLARFGVDGAVIVGSNGKGSTAAMTAALLQQTGASVGLFTSPHLLDLEERFRIDGEDIADGELERHWERVKTAAEATGLDGELGGFEFLFLIAADWFAARGCAHTVWEAGIGGRLDPVRLIRARRLALTSLDLEHTQLLGNSLDEIGREKIEAAPAGATLYVAASSGRQAMATRCVEMGVDYVLVPPFYESPVPLAGKYRNENAALAVHVATDIAPLSDAQVARGLAATRWPGRLEVLSDAPFTVIDVGHTPDAVRLAREAFDELRGERDAVLVCGVSVDKDAAAIVGALAPGFSTIVCVAAHHKGAPPAVIAARAQEANPTAEIVLAESVTEARRLAISRAGAEGALYAAGGLFLAAEFKAAHIGRDPATLAFF
jgi:dihydrofolate synthase/folylpolyglutamate synthase